MKKLYGLCLAMAMLLSLNACKSSVSPPTEPEAYVSSDAVSVVVSYMDGKAKVITRKITEKEITYLDIACIYFDQEGKPLGKFEKIEGAVEVEDAVSNWSFDAPVGCAYLQAAISAVTYADGTKERCPGVDTWVAETTASFDVESHIESLQKQAALAETCPVLALDWEFTTQEGLVTKVKNQSEQEIDNVIIYTLWYDTEGLPVDVGGSFAQNATRAALAELAVGDEARFTIPTEEGAAKAKQVVEKVIFADGTIWENENAYHWIAANLEFAE